MSDDELIEQAVRIFHQRKPRLPRSGDVIAHLSDDYTYEVRRVTRGKVIAFYVDENGQEVVKEFPLNEVFNPGAVQAIVLELRSQMN